nr:MAG TPA: hypothetical protein [Caudoviricetes sp.]
MAIKLTELTAAAEAFGFAAKYDVTVIKKWVA